MTNLTIDLESISMTDEQFFLLCQNNRDLKFERNANGDLIGSTSPLKGAKKREALRGTKQSRFRQ